MELQPRLFDDLPSTREETPVHQLNYPTFAEAENTLWHGRLRGGGALMGGPLSDDTVAKRTGWDSAREDPVHVGTFEAAAHRGLGEHRARRPERAVHGGPATPSPDEYRPRDEMMELAGVHREDIGFGTNNQTSAQMLPFRVREGSMYNAPDIDPVSDAYANLAAGEYGGDDYEGQYANELLEAGEITTEQWDESQEFGYDPEEVYGDRYPEPLSMTGGLYYRNAHEDPGSISAVVPTARDLQHWPTEVMEHSADPAKRRTAEFLLGRGY